MSTACGRPQVGRGSVSCGQGEGSKRTFLHISEMDKPLLLFCIFSERLGQTQPVDRKFRLWAEWNVDIFLQHKLLIIQFNTLTAGPFIGSVANIGQKGRRLEKFHFCFFDVPVLLFNGSKVTVHFCLFLTVILYEVTFGMKTFETFCNTESRLWGQVSQK